MNNKEVAHLWANQSRPRANGSHFYFDGDTIYSYGSHFPIARHYKGVVLVTLSSYSNSTSRHISITLDACSHLTRFYVDNPTRKPNGKDVKLFRERIENAGLAAARARNPAYHLERLEGMVQSANLFCKTFGFKTVFSMPDDATLAALKERAKVSAEREGKAKALKQAKFERECAEAVQKWINGEGVQIPYGLTKVYLRSKLTTDGATVQTSKGVTVPMAEAEKAFRFAMIQRNRGWHKNGDQFKVGDYQLDAVNDQGVVAGCHRIAWDEIDRFAKLQGWIGGAQ